jgi:hypothetical protein
MALKKIQFRSNDVVHVKMIADEINNMQGIQHDNLVKIYGAELHRVTITLSSLQYTKTGQKYNHFCVF